MWSAMFSNSYIKLCLHYVMLHFVAVPYKSSFIFSGKPLSSTAVRHVGQISSVNPGPFTDLAPLPSSASSTMNLLSKKITSLVSSF
jgi:hypothetical protein